MRWRPFILGLATGWFGLSSPVWAIVIVEKAPGAIPVGGFFVSDDGKTLKIQPSGDNEPVKEYDRSKYDIRLQIDRGRLEKLDKDTPKAYYDYAKELLADKYFADDPEAQETARRLFLIAAFRDPGQFGPGALLSMSDFARTDAEYRRCRAMAFLLDPKDNADALRPAPLSPTSALKDFEGALRCYRTGLQAKAKESANAKDVDKVFSKALGRIDRETFVKWCTDAEGLTGNPREDRMRRILRAELWVIDQLSHDGAGDKTSAADGKWSSVLQARQVKHVRPLSLETVTDDLDPHLCLYRDGKWVAP